MPPEWTHFLDEHFAIVFSFSFAWIVTGFIGSALFRRSRGKAIFAVAPADAVFVDRWASGRSLRNVLTKIGGANNCLMIAVTPDILRVCPHFPFTLLFLPEIYGLDWTILRSDIRGVESVPRFFGRETIVVAFDDARGIAEKLELRVHSPGKLQIALAKWSERG